MNALAHALEAGYAPDTTDRGWSSWPQEALRALATGAGRLPSPGVATSTARSDALYGAWLAGWALGSTTMGLHHKLAHVLGGTLPAAARRCPQRAAAARGRVQRPGRAGRLRRARRSALGVAGPDRVAPALFDLAERLGAPDVAGRRSGCGPTASTTWPPPSPRADVPNPRGVRADSPTCARLLGKAR